MSLTLPFALRYVLLLLSALLLSSLPVVAAATASSSVTLYAHPYSASSSPKSPPTPLAQIEYDASKATASVLSYTAPTSATGLLRIGFADPDSGHWRGIVTDATSFTNSYKKKILIHVDEKGEVYHVGLSTGTRTKTQGSEDEVEVELVQRRSGPRPVLNQPVVLNAEGKLDSKEPEKTFLQKYWWALLLFIAVQLLAGGGEK